METRQKLRQLIKKGTEITNQIYNEGFDYFMKHLSQMSETNNEVNSNENNILQLKTSATRLSHSVFDKVLEANDQFVFDENDFVSRLESIIVKDGNVDWSSLRPESVFHSAPISMPMFGSVDLTVTKPKPKPVAQKRHASSTREESLPTKITGFDHDGSQALELFYRELLKCFEENHNRPMPFFKVICDPQSFTNSVNNAFQASFLVQSNLIRVFKEAGETMVQPVDPSIGYSAKKSGERSVHAVITLDYDLWRETIDTYGIESSMMVNRSL